MGLRRRISAKTQTKPSDFSPINTLQKISLFNNSRPSLLLALAYSKTELKGKDLYSLLPASFFETYFEDGSGGKHLAHLQKLRLVEVSNGVVYLGKYSERHKKFLLPKKVDDVPSTVEAALLKGGTKLKMPEYTSFEEWPWISALRTRLSAYKKSHSSLLVDSKLDIENAAILVFKNSIQAPSTIKLSDLEFLFYFLYKIEYHESYREMNKTDKAILKDLMKTYSPDRLVSMLIVFFVLQDKIGLGSMPHNVKVFSYKKDSLHAFIRNSKHNTTKTAIANANKNQDF